MEFEDENLNIDNSEATEGPITNPVTSKGNLHALPSTTVRLLGSSQVITSVHSVVKELIENSLDAGATSVDVKLENYGLSKIEVRDNGCGIDEKDIDHVAKHYHTSKISSFQDLQILQTYGFRGEALGSLCALSNVSITSKTESAAVGQTVWVNNQGEIISSKPSHFGKGTCVTALNLFKNLPVRKQFYSTVKKKKEELKKVEDLVMSYAVIRPDLRVSLRHDKDLIWQKFAVLDHKTVLLNILGTATFNQLVKRVLTNEDPKMDIEAFLPKPNSKVQLTSRATNDKHLTFINRRPIIMKEAGKLVRQYYSSHQNVDSSSSNRYPIYFLSVALPPGDLDVNVEPNKTKVILENQDILLQVLTKMLEEHYAAEIPTASRADSNNQKIVENNNNLQETCTENERDGENISTATCNDQQTGQNENGQLSFENSASKIIEDERPYRKDVAGSSSANLRERDQTTLNCSQDSSFGPFNLDLEVLTPPESQVYSNENVTNLAEMSKESQENALDKFLLESDIKVEEADFSKGDNLSKGNHSTTLPESSQKDLAFKELMDDLNEDDILCTFDDTCRASNQNKIDSYFLSDSQNEGSASALSTSADQWSRGTGLMNKDGKHIEGPALLRPCLPADVGPGAPQHVNNNGKRPPSPAEMAHSGPPPKKPAIKTLQAETTMFDLISSKPIKRPQTAFILFSKEVRPKVVQDNPTLTFQDTARLIGQMWQALSKEEKKKYEELSSKDVERYKQEVSTTKHSPIKGKKKQMSRRSSLSIKECLLNMMSPRPSKPGHPIKSPRPSNSGHPSSQHVPIKSIDVKFDMDHLKGLYSRGLGTSQSQFPSEMNLIGCIKSHGSWVCCQGNQLSMINTSRIEETILHYNMMKNHVLKPATLENQINLDSRLVNSGHSQDLYATLVTIATERSRLIGGRYHIVDKRVTDNGFDLIWNKGENGDCSNIQIVGMSAAIQGYGVSDLKEILEQVTMTSASAVSQCRPFKVISYLKSEAVRIMRNSPIKTQREDVEELLEELANQIPGNCATCLHDKPFYHQLYDLSNFTFSQTQSTQG